MEIERFLIGAATAAHQVEGNNIHSDNWVMENLRHSDFVEPSGLAVDHYNRYEEDIKLLADAGCSAYRFSIEWARIEPARGAPLTQMGYEDYPQAIGHVLTKVAKEFKGESIVNEG